MFHDFLHLMTFMVSLQVQSVCWLHFMIFYFFGWQKHIHGSFLLHLLRSILYTFVAFFLLLIT